MKTKRTLPVMAAAIIVTLATLACQLTAPRPTSANPEANAPAINSQPPISVQAPLNPAAAQDAFVTLYQQVIPGVVIIKVTTQQGNALGSGFVYDTGGHVVTNFHVVQGAANDKVEVDFMDGFKAYGTVVGTDLDSDLAVVKVDAPASQFHPLTVGDSDKVAIGQTVVASLNAPSLFLIAKGKVYPLWYSPYLTTLFYLSAIPAGIAMLTIVLYLCVRSLNVKLEFSLPRGSYATSVLREITKTF